MISLTIWHLLSYFILDKGGIIMYYYGGGSCGCNQGSYYPMYGYGWGYGNSQNGSNYAIILVLFILLVIVIGARYAR